MTLAAAVLGLLTGCAFVLGAYIQRRIERAARKSADDLIASLKADLDWFIKYSVAADERATAAFRSVVRYNVRTPREPHGKMTRDL